MQLVAIVFTTAVPDYDWIWLKIHIKMWLSSEVSGKTPNIKSGEKRKLNKKENAK